MGRSKGRLMHHIDRDGAAYAWWTDGHGRKILRRLYEAEGKGIAFGEPIEVRERAGMRAYDEWCSAAEREDRDGEGKALTLGDRTARYVETQGKCWDLKTMRHYATYLEDLEGHFGHHRSVLTITPDDAEQCLDAIQRERGFGPTTFSNRAVFFRTLFQWMKERGELEVNPFATIKAPSNRLVKSKADPFSPEEVQLVIKAARKILPWFAPVVETGAVTGAHREELTLLNVKDLHLTERKLVIPREIAKQQAGREFGLCDKVVDILMVVAGDRAPMEPLFLNEMGRRVSSKTFDMSLVDGKYRRPWRKVLDEAGVRLRGFNSLREAVDTNLFHHLKRTQEEAAFYTGHSVEVSRAFYLGRPTDVTRATMKDMHDLYLPDDPM